MVLNNYLAQAGICSRRNAAKLIKDGLILVNGKIVKDPSYVVQEHDSVKYQNKLVRIEQKIYVLLNKPAGYVSTTSDELGRKTIIDLVPQARKKRLFPIGRLDKDTTGLIVLTNDGALTQKLAHPRYRVEKVYEVTLDQPLLQEDLIRIKKGIRLRDGIIRVDAISFPDYKNKNRLKVTLHSGKKHIIRRIFEALERTVKKLDRINYAGLTQKGLQRGASRLLSKEEIALLNGDDCSSCCS